MGICYILEVKRFTEFTVLRGSAVTIRFTILFLRVLIWLGSLKCKQKSSIRLVITACKKNILLHSDQFRIVVPLHDYFRQVFNDYNQQKQCI